MPVTASGGGGGAFLYLLGKWLGDLDVPDQPGQRGFANGRNPLAKYHTGKGSDA